MHKITKTLLLTLALVVITSVLSIAVIAPTMEYVKGRVIEIHSEVDPGQQAIQLLTVEILTGKYKGIKAKIDNFLWEEEGYNTRIKAGMPLTLKITDREGEPPFIQIMGYYRSPYIYLAGLLFVLIFIVIMGFKKITALISIVLNVTLVILVLLPLLKAGYPPVAVTLITGSVMASLTIALVIGFGRKFIAAIIGVVAGLVLAGLLTSTFIDLMHLSGMFAGDSRMLLIAYRHIEGWRLHDLRGLLSAGVMIACLGAVIDVSVTVVSACYNISKKMTEIKPSLLWSSGMQVGRDVIATMLNSLMMIFVSISLPMVAVFNVLEIPFLKVINFEFFTVMIVSAIVASTALIVTVPATAAASSWLLRGEMK